MAKFSRIPKLSKKEQESLILEFCRAIAEMKTLEEAANFIKDLLSKQEAEMLAKRIAIARMLIEGKNYQQINAFLKASYGTIARISHWLATSGEGYRLIVKRVKPEKVKGPTEELLKPLSWNSMKHRYPLYFWPEILIEEIIKTANKKQKERLSNILNKFESKSEVFDNIKPFLKEAYGPKNKIDKNSNTT